MRGELDESFADLKFNVNNNDGYTSEEGSNSNFDRTTDAGMDGDRSQRAPAMVSPTLTSEFGNGRICELICSSFSNASFLTKMQLNHMIHWHPLNHPTMPSRH